MKRPIIILGIIAISLVFSSANANAYSVSFVDTSKYWPGWSNGSSDDSHDVIGKPNFTGGQAEITIGQRLTNLTFNRASGTSGSWGALSPGDLFINIGNDQYWDYVVDLSAWGTSGPNNSDPLAGNYNIYSLSLALNDASGYILSGADRTGDWRGYYIRDGHPVAAIVDGNPDGSAYFSGWGNGSTTQYSFDFDDLNLGNSGQFTIGWQPNCANDVVYETLHYQTTPEPATMALLGMGVAGLLASRKRKVSRQ